MRRWLAALCLFLSCLCPIVLRAEETGNLRFLAMVPYGASRDAFGFELRVSEPLEGVYGSLVFHEGRAAFSLREGEEILAEALPAGTAWTLSCLGQDAYTARFYSLSGYPLLTPRGRVPTGEEGGLTVAMVPQKRGDTMTLHLDFGEALPEGNGTLRGQENTDAAGRTITLHADAAMVTLRASSFAEYGERGQRREIYSLEREEDREPLTLQIDTTLNPGESMRPEDDYIETALFLFEGNRPIGQMEAAGTGVFLASFAGSEEMHTARPVEAEYRPKGDVMLLGRGLQAGEFTFSIYEDGKRVSTGSNDENGRIAFSSIAYTVEDVGPHTYIIRQELVPRVDLTLDDAVYTAGVMLFAEEDGLRVAETGLFCEGSPTSVLRFENKYALVDFKVYHLWQGGNEGNVELILYANGERLREQPEYTVENATYLFENLPMYDAWGNPILYSARELYVEDYMAMYLNVGEYASRSRMLYNGGTVINRKVTEFPFQVVYIGFDEAERPEVRVNLYAGDEAIYADARPGKDEYGRFLFRNLPVKWKGKTAEYTAELLGGEDLLIAYENPSPYEGVTTRLVANGKAIIRQVPRTGVPGGMAGAAVRGCLALAGLSVCLFALQRSKKEKHGAAKEPNGDL